TFIHRSKPKVEDHALLGRTDVAGNCLQIKTPMYFVVEQTESQLYLCRYSNIKHTMKRILLFLFVAVVSVHCSKDDDEDQSEIDDKIITAYIADNDLDAQNIGDGLYFVNEQTGGGESPTASSTVRV